MAREINVEHTTFLVDTIHALSEARASISQTSAWHLNSSDLIHTIDVNLLFLLKNLGEEVGVTPSANSAALSEVK